MTNIDLRDTIAGLLLIAMGVSVAMLSRNYGLGQLQNMGAGYFPFILGIILGILGVFVLLPALFRAGTAIHIDYRGMIAVLLSVVTFAALLEPAGLVVTILATTFFSTIPGNLSWKGKLTLGISVALITSVIFVYGLGMTIPVWPWSA